ncbi:MAG: hypothetical protein LBG83_04715 [Oscillospiraceae bacterium]|jgi:YVTN family beta-propeller protein|nr:hypothetical protein [Oscillospiraceae bacterium]
MLAACGCGGVCDAGTAYLLNNFGNEIVTVDPTTHLETGSFALPSNFNASGILQSSKTRNLYVTNGLETLAIDPATGQQLASLSIPQVRKLVDDPVSGKIYALTGSGETYEIDPETNAATQTNFTTATDIAVDQTTGDVYLTNGSDQLRRYTADGGSGWFTMPMAADHIVVDSKNQEGYVYESGNNEVGLFDLSDVSNMSTIFLGDSLANANALVNPNQQEVYLLQQSNGISVVSYPLQSKVDTLPGEPFTRLDAFDEANNQLYVTKDSNSMYVFDGATNQQTATLPVFYPNGVAVAGPCGPTGSTGPCECNACTPELVACILEKLEDLGCGCSQSCTTNPNAYALEDNEVAVIDGNTHQQTKSFPLPAGETGVSIVANPKTNKLYVGTDSGRVLVFNADSGALVSTIDTGTGVPVDQMAFDSVNGMLYLVQGTDGIIYDTNTEMAMTYSRFDSGNVSLVVDPVHDQAFVGTANSLSSWSVSQGLTELQQGGAENLAFDSAGNQLFYTANHEVFALDTQTDTSFGLFPYTDDFVGHMVYDPAANSLIGMVSSTSLTSYALAAYDVSSGQQSIIYSHPSSYSAIRPGYDPRTNEIYLYNNGETLLFNGTDYSYLGSIAMNTVNGYAFAGSTDCPYCNETLYSCVENYLAGQGWGPVSSLSCSTALVDCVVQELRARGVLCSDLAYISLTDKVNLYDPHARQVVGSFSTANQNYVVAVNSGARELYIGTSAGVEVRSMDTYALKATLGSGNDQEVLYNPNNDKLYVANMSTGNVEIYQASTRALLALLSIPNLSPDFSLEPATNTVYVIPSSGGNMYAINGNLNTDMQISIANPKGEAVDTVNHKLYVTCQPGGNNQISIFNTQTNTLLSTVPLSYTPSVVQINPKTGQLYVTGVSDQKIHVYDTETMQEIKTIDSPNSNVPVLEGVDAGNNLIYAMANATPPVFMLIDGKTNSVAQSMPMAGMGKVTAASCGGGAIRGASAAVSVSSAATGPAEPQAPPAGAAICTPELLQCVKDYLISEGWGPLGATGTNESAGGREPVIPAGVPAAIDGAILSAAKAGDTSDWIQIAVLGDFSLLLRKAALPTGKLAFGGGTAYAASTLRAEMIHWFGYVGDLRTRYALPNDSMSALGSGAADSGFSRPVSARADGSGGNVFALSFGEAARFCSTQYYNGTSLTQSAAIPAANFGKLTGNASIESFATLPDDEKTWLRTPIDAAHVGAVGYSGGAATYGTAAAGRVYGDVVSRGNWIRPAVWVLTSVLG